jgi:ribosomal protein S12 methylthiotransferase
MRRFGDPDSFLALLADIRRQAPAAGVRSNFIVGFPGETDEDFEALLDFVEEAAIDRAGVFKFEPVSGAPASGFDGEVPADVKDQRYAELMQVAQAVSAGQLAKKIGRTIDVLVDDVRPDEDRAIGRSQWDAPEIDGQVIIDSAAGIKPGDKVTVSVTGSDAYDLFAVPVGTVREPAAVVAA